LGPYGLTSHTGFPGLRDRADPSEGSRCLSAARGPSSDRLRTPLCRAIAAAGGGTSRALRLHRGDSHENGSRRSSVPALPREGRSVPAKTEVRSTASAPARDRGSLPALTQVGLSSTRHLCSRAPTLCSSREPAPFRPPAMPGVTSQAFGAAQSNDARGWFAAPSRTLDRSTQKRLP
jgi:hypothetical protein